MNELDSIRYEVLQNLSTDQNAIDSVFQYCHSPFDQGLLPEKPYFPLDNEPHVIDWEDYLAESGEAAFEKLQEKIPQLNIPIGQGICETQAYANIVRRGKPFNKDDFGEKLSLHNPDKFKLDICRHPAGSLPVLTTSDKDDFKKLYWALACRCTPKSFPDSVNAYMIAGLINWDRVQKYKEEWQRSGPLFPYDNWGMEMKRVAQKEPWRFKDRLIILCKAPYSAVCPEQLALDISPETWLEKSNVLRKEHEFTHYATWRLYNQMRNNALDETIADYMGITATLGQYRAQWFLTFLGLEEYPKIRPGGRIFTYRGQLDDQAFDLLLKLIVQAAKSLENLSLCYYKPNERQSFFIALTCMTLELLAADNAKPIFHKFYNLAMSSECV